MGYARCGDATRALTAFNEHRLVIDAAIAENERRAQEAAAAAEARALQEGKARRASTTLSPFTLPSYGPVAMYAALIEALSDAKKYVKAW